MNIKEGNGEVCNFTLNMESENIKNIWLIASKPN